MTDERMTSDRLEELAACSALDACDLFERRALRRLVESAAAPADIVDEMVEVAALVGLSVDEVEPPPLARNRLLDRLEPKSVKIFSTAPIGGLQTFTVRADEGDWQASGEGVEIKHLYTDFGRGTQSFLLRLGAGAALPPHRHPSIEEILVLTGDCRINGETLLPGDYRCALPGSVDRSLTTETGTTVFIVGPVRY